MIELVAAALDSPKASREPSRIVQMVFNGEGEVLASSPMTRPEPEAGTRVKRRASASPQIPSQSGQGVTSPPGMAVLLVPIENGMLPFPGVGKRGGGYPFPAEVSAQPELVPQGLPEGFQDQAAPRQSPSGTLVAPPVERESDLRGLKREVERLPHHHPMRLALRGEPDRMPRAELVLKMREWLKYLGWQDSP